MNESTKERVKACRRVPNPPHGLFEEAEEVGESMHESMNQSSNP
jgi:hypothetical protein